MVGRLPGNTTPEHRTHRALTMPDFPEEKIICLWQAVLGQSASEKHLGIRYRCVRCGFLTEPSLYRESLPQRTCDRPHEIRQPVRLPSLYAQALNFTQALQEHIQRGSPESTREEILESFRFCSKCQYYSDLSGQCSDCGCYVNLALSRENLNKLSWADQECPKGFWQAPLVRRQYEECNQENKPFHGR